MANQDRIESLKKRHRPDDLKALKEQLDRHYQKMHSEMLEADDYYQLRGGNVRMELPDGVPMHVPSTPANIVDNMADQIDTDSPVVTLRPRNEGERPHLIQLQNWALDRLRAIKQWGEFDTFEDAKRHLLLRGASCVKVIIDEEVMPALPDSDDFEDDEEFEEAMDLYKEAKTNVEPFITRALDPVMVMVAPGNRRPHPFALEVREKTLSDMEQYTDWTDPIGRELAASKSEFNTAYANDPSRRIEWLEFMSAPLVVDGEIIDPGAYIIWADGEELVREDNPYGVVPYDFTYSGLGMEHSDGDPSHRAVGLLNKIEGELAAEIRIKTAWDAQWQYHVFPTWMVRENAALAKRMLSKGPGRIIEWGKLGDEKPDLKQPQPPDANMIAFLNAVLGNITRFFAPSLAGDDDSEFGILTSIRIGQQLKVIEPVWKSLNAQGGRVLGLMARMAHHQNLEFRVRGGRNQDGRSNRLGSAQFDRFDFEVTFERIDPAEDQRKLLVGEQLHEGGRITYQTFARKFARTTIEDPDEEEEALIAERIINQIIESGALAQSVMERIQRGGNILTESQAAVEQFTGPEGTEARRQAPQPETDFG